MSKKETGQNEVCLKHEQMEIKSVWKKEEEEEEEKTKNKDNNNNKNTT